MFVKRKYSRKTHNRKPFRRKTRRKTVLRPAPEVPAPTFDAAGSSVYSWMYCTPSPVSSPKAVASSEKPSDSRPLSLRKTAAQALALNADSIHPTFLDEAPWSCWSLVWHHILALGLDSPDVFRMFCVRFGSQSDFRCHGPQGPMPRTHASARSVMQAALSACLAPTLRLHRLENVFSNIAVPEFVSYVSGLPAAVLLDCSAVRSFTPAQLVAFASVRSLEALDLSNTSIDDQFLYTLRASLVSKGSRLQILRICNCPNISEAGLRVLLADPSAPALAYIEADVRVARGSTFSDAFSAAAPILSIPGTRWRVVPDTDPAIGVVHKFHLANKLLALSRNVPVFSPPSLMWDFKFFPHVVNDTEISEELAYEAWKSRLLTATSTPAHRPVMYLKDAATPAPNEPAPAPAAAPELSVFSRAGQHVPDKPKFSSVRKPRTMTTNASSFFLGS